MSQAVVPLQSYMRIVAATAFFYDYLVTIPSEIRLIRRQHDLTRPSHACILFMLARYVGMAAVISATVIYFHGWTLPLCSHLIEIVGAFRALLSTVTNLVLMWRTWAIWRRNRYILYMMLIVLIPTTIFSYGFLFDQTPLTRNGACTAVSGKTVFGQKWTFALGNMIFDIIAFFTCTARLVGNIKREKGMSGLSSLLLSDGIFYFVIVMIGHALNLSFLLSPDPARSNSFLTFNVALTAICSQRIITSLSERVTLTPSTGSRARSNSRSRSRTRPRVVSNAATHRNPLRYMAGMRDVINKEGTGDDVELGVDRVGRSSKRAPIAIDVHHEQETHIDGDDLIYGMPSDIKSKASTMDNTDLTGTLASSVHFEPHSPMSPNHPPSFTPL